MGRRNRQNHELNHNLPQLQNLIKRDSESYSDEFNLQYRHFESLLSLVYLNPSEEHTEFCELVNFLAQTVGCYPDFKEKFANTIIELLREKCLILNMDFRKTLVQCLILLKNKGTIDSLSLLSLFFTLFRCKDKTLRENLYKFIVNDIKDMNAKHKNNKLNRTLQNFMYTMLMTETSQAGHNDKNSSSEHVIAGKKSLEVCIELYQKNIWNDHKTVNVIAEACLSPITKIMVTAVHFFLGNNEQKEESDDEEDIDLRKLDHQSTINKKTKSRSKKREKALAKMRRKERKSNQAESFNFSALHLIHDPQGFAEKLFSRLGKATNEGFPVRLSLMKLIARVVGVHKLMLLGFYPYLMRYLQPSQKDVTQVLALTAQACHELVPPDVVEPCIMAIANNFVTQNMSNEVMAAGINGIREICHRTPLAMSSALLQDLTEYKGTRDKGVMMAARSLIGLFREINPELLKRKDRGRTAAMKLNAEGSTALQFGEVKASSFIEGTELLDDDEFEKLNGEAEGSDEEEEIDSDDEGIPELVDEEGEDDVLELGSDEELDEDDMEEFDEEDDEDGDDEDEDEDEDEELEEDDEELEDEEPASEPKAKSSAKAVKPSQPKSRLEVNRILTQEDFEKIAERRQQLELDRELNGSTNKRKADAANNDDSDDGEIVDESAILRFQKKKKSTYEDRMASIQAGREGREKFGHRTKKTEAHSTTNKEKRKTKNFKMITHKRSVVSKGKKSLRDKQIQLRANIKKQKARAHKR